MLQIKHQAAGGSMKCSTFPYRQRAVIRGAGDIATGVALRLYHVGFHVIMLEVEYPTVIRCTVAFAQAIYAGKMTIEGVTAKHINRLDEADPLLQQGIIPLLIDEDASLLPAFQADGVVDAILAKQNRGTHRAMAPVTIALGPGFEAGKDCNAIIETNRRHNLGRVIYQGSAQANTGVPGNINGYTTQRVVRAPVTAVMRRCVNIGDIVNVGDNIAYIDNTPIKAPLSGMVRGLLNDNLSVTVGFNIGDIDPRGAAVDFTAVSDKARAISGRGVRSIDGVDGKIGLVVMDKIADLFNY
ncbi:hypothetical protein ARAF_2004 [Arsenophonus endosymbiont of Aleurodicus floccissimus]|nr:hypothetical protein ARAF_2004 [Arsenophonus endosymbiont of Aleurodicus floccissimus]